MILSGILHSSLGGFTVIRGVAPLGDLARCSKFDPDFQRNLIEPHREEIVRFLDDPNYCFFPEVVLSASLMFDFEKFKGVDRRSPLARIFERHSFKSNVNGLSIKVINSKLPKQVVGGPGAPEIAYLELPEDRLANGLKLLRIDGNHRLSAARDARLGDDRYKLPTPFCIVLHEDSTKAKRFEKVTFHNINSKQIPLTSEENLKLILQEGEGALFDDKTLLESPSFGPAYYLARKLLADIDDRYLTGLKKPLENCRTLALALSQFLANHDVAIGQAKDADTLNAQVPRLREALKAVNIIYENRAKLAESGCHGVLVAFLYFALRNDGKQLPAFEQWVVSNRIDHLAPDGTTQGLGYHYHLGRTQAVDAASLVSVFESILKARGHEVFVSMEFGQHTEATYKTIEKTIKRINDKHNLDAIGLALKPIRIDRTNKGHSYTINDEILNVIDGTGLLIADLTCNNKNVYHEVGFLMGLNQGKGSTQENFLLIADSNVVKDKDIGFNLRPWQQIRFANTLELEEKLTESLEIYYKLNGDF